ncbi:MAG: tetratricopeptide repeat protein [Bacteroidota bacterium]
MRKIILLVFVPTFSYFLNAQTLEDAKKQFYYEKFESSLQTFQQLIKQNPDNGEAWFGLMKSYFALKKPEKITDTVKYAPPSVMNDPYFKIVLGANQLQQNRKEEANAIFNNVLEETKKKNAGIVSAIAWTQLNVPNGDPHILLPQLNEAIKKNKHNPELYVLLGDAYRKLRDGTEAFKAYQKAVDEDGKYALAYYRMGQIFLTQKNKDVYTDYFQKSIAADPDFAPAYYRLYLYEFNRDPAKAMSWYQKYAALSDISIQNDYDLADLFYLNKQYDSAIVKANEIITSGDISAKPRIYKLMGYSYAGKKDTSKAIDEMKKYFEKEADSNIIAMDYLSMGQFYLSHVGSDSLAGIYLAKATTVERDSTKLFDYYKMLADLAKTKKDYESQAKWLGKFYSGNSKASNLDLFYWGVANYRIEDYPKADSIFGIYIDKYPDQSFGYYWQAKSKALQDKEMDLGLAIPSYQKLVEVLQKDTTDANYKKWMVEAYGYLAAYEVNSRKDYTAAITYFEKTLNVDPENESARKYIDMLEKKIKDPVETNKGN